MRRTPTSTIDGSDAPPADEPEQLLSIGAAAAQAGVSERALRYYQEIGLLTPSGSTPGGLRRYSQGDLARVARIRELQTLLGLNLEEIAVVLGNDDRMAEMRAAYHDRRTGDRKRRAILQEILGIQNELKETVEAKRKALDDFLADLDTRVGRIQDLLDDNQ